ncbi:hypothetical protein RHSIM_Rhsim07G0235800 [Rhododendron simsii]|uniref:Calcium uniporter protein C-terminal domain-containing protein n=1 Tax=Rhododendron simsii TaxID=118357 RepID=A0A834GQG9_RHOSS|nr:hypothetical protein RHSIM_Rhsim07G0235800 [Rhododendron simsii]
MALRRTLSKRLFNKSTDPISTNHSQFQTPPPASKANFHREFLTSPGSADAGFLHPFLHRRSISHPDFSPFPIGENLKEIHGSTENLKEKQRLINLTAGGDRLRLDGLRPPAAEVLESLGGITVEEARKIARSTQLEKVRSALRRIPANSISYGQYVQACVEVCLNSDQGVEFAKMLDQSGNVIVLGNVVFLRPEQVAKSMEKVISNSIAIPNDPRRKELEKLEKQKAAIDKKAQRQVQTELLGGLGFIVLQTLGFMRLTFWELSWDVMEPICFFFTSLSFPLACGFFLRTSKEPTFEGFFRRRFKVKQKKLMETHKFDSEKYNELCRAFYPNYDCDVRKYADFSGLDLGGGSVFGAVHR